MKQMTVDLLLTACAALEAGCAAWFAQHGEAFWFPTAMAVVFGIIAAQPWDKYNR